MRVKLELLTKGIADILKSRIDDLEFDASEIVDTSSTQILEEIKRIISDNTLCDFDAIEEIVLVFEKHGIDCGSRHDF